MHIKGLTRLETHFSLAGKQRHDSVPGLGESCIPLPSMTTVVSTHKPEWDKNTSFIPKVKLAQK